MTNTPIELKMRDGQWKARVADEHGIQHDVSFGEDYERAVCEFEAFLEVIYRGRRTADTITQASLTLSRAYTLYMQWAVKNYRTPVTYRQTTMCRKIGAALDSFVEKYGHMPLIGVSIAHIRNEILLWIQRGLKVSTVNQYKDTLERFFKWAVETFDMHRDMLDKIKAIPAIESHRAFATPAAVAVAKPSVHVTPVPPEHVEKTLKFIKKEVYRDMIRLMMNTGMRPGEVRSFRMCDVTIADEHVWRYTPAEHKNSRKAHREIIIGPQAQEIISKYFTSLTSQERPFNVAYESWRAATQRAAIRAGVPVWRLNQIRHTVATTLAAVYGLDTAREVLGHAGLKMTLRYAERSESKEARAARQAIREIG